MATRKQIQDYLNIRDNIDVTVNAILNNIVPIDIVAKHNECYNIIKLTVKVVQQKEKYLKNKLLYEAAINEYQKSKREAITGYNLVSKYGLNCYVFDNEVRDLFPGETYVYTRMIEGEGFTYPQEESLWQFLKWLIDIDFIFCTCRTCFLSEASIYVYECVKRWNLLQRYSHWCPCERASIYWVQKFEIRYRSEISSLCSKLCKKSCSIDE